MSCHTGGITWGLQPTLPAWRCEFQPWPGWPGSWYSSTLILNQYMISTLLANNCSYIYKYIDVYVVHACIERQNEHTEHTWQQIRCIVYFLLFALSLRPVRTAWTQFARHRTYRTTVVNCLIIFGPLELFWAGTCQGTGCSKWMPRWPNNSGRKKSHLKSGRRRETLQRGKQGICAQALFLSCPLTVPFIVAFSILWNTSWYYFC